MSDSNDPLQQLGLAGIQRRCAEESERFFERQPNDPRWCFELLRRAIVEQKEAAWQLIYTQYRPLVSGWVRRHANFEDTGEELAYLVNCAFEKFWSAVTPDKFLSFPDLKAVLRYLQMCVHSVIVDHVRVNAHTSLTEWTEQIVEGDGEAWAVTSDMLDDVQRGEFWRWLEVRLHNDKERCVVYGSFFLALKPRELHAQFRGVFRNPSEVHRVKENVLARLRRDLDLRRFFGEDAGNPADSSFSE